MYHLLSCRKRKAVVLALRGTMSMADIVTDAVAHPEQIDDWLPPHFAKARWASTSSFRSPAPNDADCLYVYADPRRPVLSPAFSCPSGSGAGSHSQHDSWRSLVALVKA